MSEGLRARQIFSRRAARAGFACQRGSGRPEKTEAPAVQTARWLRDFDVAMHDDHKGAIVRIRAAIGGARIGNQFAATIHVGDGRTAGLVRPEAVAAFAVPMEVLAGSDDQSNEVAFLGTAVVGSRRGDEGIGDGGGADTSTREAGVHRASGAAGLRERVGAVVRGVIVAVIVGLLLSTPAVVPPERFVKRRTVATVLVWMVGVLGVEEGDAITAGTGHLPAKIFGKTFADVELAGTACNEVFKVFGGPMREALAE